MPNVALIFESYESMPHYYKLKRSGIAQETIDFLNLNY